MNNRKIKLFILKRFGLIVSNVNGHINIYDIIACINWDALEISTVAGTRSLVFVPDITLLTVVPIMTTSHAGGHYLMMSHLLTHETFLSLISSGRTITDRTAPCGNYSAAARQKTLLIECI